MWCRIMLPAVSTVTPLLYCLFLQSPLAAVSPVSWRSWWRVARRSATSGSTTSSPRVPKGSGSASLSSRQTHTSCRDSRIQSLTQSSTRIGTSTMGRRDVGMAMMSHPMPGNSTRLGWSWRCWVKSWTTLCPSVRCPQGSGPRPARRRTSLPLGHAGWRRRPSMRHTSWNCVAWSRNTVSGARGFCLKKETCCLVFLFWPFSLLLEE